MERYISIRQIADDITDHPLLKDITFERIVDYTVTFMRIVGMPKAYLEKTSLVEIHDWRGKLPCDMESIIQVRLHDVCGRKEGVFRYATDSFHISPDRVKPHDLTYKVQDSVIFTSVKEGVIEIAYWSLKTDDEGYPMIPDNGSYVSALEAYIKKKRFTVLLDMGLINAQAFNQAAQDYAWYVGQAQSDLVRPSIDEMESLTNMLNTLVTRDREHRRTFRNEGSRELIRRQ